MHKRKWLQFTALIGFCAIAVNSPWNVRGIPSQEDVQEVSNTNDKNYGVVNVNTILNVRQDKGTEYDIIARLPNKAVCYIESVENGWAYIRSGNVYGYVSQQYLYQDDEAWQIVHEMGEENMPVANWSQPVQDEFEEEEEAGVQEALAATVPAYTMSNVETRMEIVEFAQQFLGNPYVWGGTSLTNGADCSGFVQSIYAQFGIQLPRVSEDQAQVGIRVAVEDANPADLIFYESEGQIYHVVIYIGDGQVVHASSTVNGIKISNIYYENAVYAVSLM